jgi:hypothetical protein
MEGPVGAHLVLNHLGQITIIGNVVVLSVQDERTNKLKCDDGDADDAHGSEEHDWESRWSSILEFWTVYYICMYVF